MLKNIKSLFIVSEEEESNIKKENQSNSQPNNVKPQVSTPAAAPFEPSSGSVDNAILDKLFQALEENNQTGFDYMEFRKALLTLKALPMDEATKFQSTFATASTIGVTLEKLLESIDFYKKVLEAEDTKFTKAIKEQTSVNIDDKIAAKDKITIAIKEKSDQIQKLTNEIRNHQLEISKLSSSIETAESKIKETALNFETSLKVIKTQLDQDAIKLKQYIK